ncbi:tRNA-dihydrouridine synthase family protein [Patescibacteria group bacterium]|nr:tRNA-dihydrouridine synthase family protein [Patescibacteria group bacterium]
MVSGFWKKIAARAKKEKRPIMVAAPMANVTDAAFRRMLAKYGKRSIRRKGYLDALWTEFVSCEGLCSPGRDVLLQDLMYDRSERPIVAQFFGAKPEHFYESARLAQKLGFDGIDINMGCPDKNVIRQGAGVGLIRTPELAQEIIRATMRGAGKLPVSVKTRIGFNSPDLKNWLSVLLETDPAAIIIHGRTKKEMSLVPAHWDIIGEAVEIRNASGKDVLVLGNGDVSSLEDAQKKYETYGVDGVMIGRAMFGTPDFFAPNKKPATLKRNLKLALEHTLLFEKLFKGEKHFDIMKKHYRSYVAGLENAKAMRFELMNLKSLDAAKKTLKKLIAEA